MMIVVEWLERIYIRLKSIEENIHHTTDLLNQIRHKPLDSFDQNFRILLTDLTRLRSEKIHFHFLIKQHEHSKQIWKKIFNIQSFINIDSYHQQSKQSIECLNELHIAIEQQTKTVDHYKEKLLEQNHQIGIYSKHLHEIQFEQDSLRCDIQQLKQRIQFEKHLHIELISREMNFHSDLLTQFHNEYIDLSTQITQIRWNIDRISIDLLPLELQLNRSILRLPSDQLEESVVIIDSLNENMMQSNLQVLPRDLIQQSKCMKIQSRKSNECSYSNRMRLDGERIVSSSFSLR